MLKYYQRFIGKKAWLFDKTVKTVLVKDKVYDVIGVEGEPTDWGTTVPVFVLRNGTDTEKCYPGRCVFLPDDSLPEEAKVQKYLSDNDVFAEEVYYPFDDEKELQVTINNGDWKHGHKRADWLMSEIGYEVQSEITIGSTLEDTYDAIHTYCKAE